MAMLGSQTPTAGRAAPYGQACLGCFKNKCKCILRPDGNGCERCHRLNKECSPARAARRRAADNRNKSHERIAELEDKLTGLISALHSRQVIDEAILAQSETMHLADAEENCGDDGQDDPVSHPEPTDAPNVLATVYLEPEPEPDFSACIDRFRSRMLNHFPFICIPPDTTTEQLRTKRPLLSHAIACVASTPGHGSTARADALRRDLCNKAFSEQQDEQPGSMMDLLLAILTYIAWGWDHISNRRSLSRPMMLAMSLVGEMHLDKPAPRHSHITDLFAIGLGLERHVDHTSDSLTSMEPQRAALGCFVLSSLICRHFAEVSALQWTPKMHESLSTITRLEESSTDRILAMQVQLELVSTEAGRLYNECQDTGPRAIATTTIGIEALLSRLQEHRGSIPQDMVYMHYTELCVFEAINKCHLEAAILTHSPSDSVDHRPWSSVHAIKSYMSGLVNLSPTQLAGISFLQWAQIAQCLVTLRRITTIDDPAWHVALRGVFDVEMLLGRLVEKLEMAATEAGQENGEDVFAQMVAEVSMFRYGIPGASGLEDPRPGTGNRVISSGAWVVDASGGHRTRYFFIDQFFS